MAKLRTERDVTLTIIGKPQGRAAASARPIEQLGLARRRRRSSAACPTSASSSSTPRPSWPSCPSSTRASRLPAIEAMATGMPARGHRRRRPARGHRRRRRDRAAVPRRATPTRWPPTHPPRPRRSRRCAPASARPGRERVVERWSWRHCAELHRRAVPRGPGHAARRRGARTAGRPPMLTVRLRPRSGCEPGDLLLDVGLRLRPPRLRGARRGARVVALDYAAGELKDVRGHVRGDGRGRRDRRPAAASARCSGDATRLPFADGTFDRVIATEVLEHIPDDVAALAELARVLQARAARSPSPCRRGCPRRSAGRCPTSTTRRSSPAATCASTPSSELRPKLRGAGLDARRRPPRPRPALAVLVAEVRGRPDQRRPPAGAGLPPAPRVGHRQGRRSSTRVDRAGPQPGARQEPRRLRDRSRRDASVDVMPRPPDVDGVRQRRPRSRDTVDAHRRAAAAQRA